MTASLCIWGYGGKGLKELQMPMGKELQMPYGERAANVYGEGAAMA